MEGFSAARLCSFPSINHQRSTINPPSLRHPMPHIRIKLGLNEGSVVPLGDRELIIGRDPACDILLDIDSLASRRHAALAPGDGGWVIRDLGSVNGTLRNGSKITEAPLAPGDEIAIGDAVFVFEDSEA